ncbi:FMN-dependent NADH-azoreductase [Sphingobium sp. CAP-1]|uniref:FMN-dependent NADH-azoreductase n=1 Tax=Sphingobium sp. CAP-1 TaxID=2676077 RepID=UPI0012BB291E|nr:NAD(P)H-dependent oxidoreductase [Sphingobium sp. CAP-1]QGP80404.1 FMN-dependent NADH-azoreductase [Sphingobium sp. CAP-1]
MTSLLHINSSIHGEQGRSSQLAATFLTHWQSANPDGTVIFRDLAADPVPPLDLASFQAFTTAATDRTEAQRAIVDQSDGLIAQLCEADEVLLGLPMYNFSVSAQLKNYFDWIARVGVTFRYTDHGPEGLIPNKPVHIMAARGGLYRQYGGDHQTPLVQDFFAMIGLTDLRFVYAEGLNISEELCADAMAEAQAEIAKLFVSC